MGNAVFIGTIQASAPEFGIAMVGTRYGGPKGSGNTLIGFLPISDSVFGADKKWAPVPSESVLCVMDPTASCRCYIIGPANATMPDPLIGNGGRISYLFDKFTASDSATQVAVLDSLIKGVRIWWENRGNKTERDQYAGDYVITDNQGGAGLLIGRYQAQLRGSPLAYIEVSEYEHTITMVGDSIGQQTLAVERVDNADLSVLNVAASPGEALGFKYGESPLKEDTKTHEVALKNDKALPFMRLQSMQGGPVDGREQVVVDFPEDETVHTATTPPTVLSRRRDSLSGALSDASTLSVLSVKSPLVPALLQRGYGEDPVKDRKEDDDKHPALRCPYTPSDEESEAEAEEETSADEDQRTIDEALNKLMDKMLSDDYVDQLIERLAQKGLQLSKQEDSVAGRLGMCGGEDAEEELRIPGGITEEQHYKLPPSIKITDPVTGREQTYYATTSFISQEPDGDILIADGYGSEIRMSRGNIYISPALDCFVRPGRDMSVMAGRNQSYNSQDVCTINTREGMYLRADKDMKIAGAMGENARQYTVTLQSGVSDGGDMAIRAAGSMSVTSKDMYVGRNKHTGLSETEVTTPDSWGGIVVDAGSKGTVSVSGGHIGADAKSITLLSHSSGDDATCIEMQGNTIGLFSMAVSCPAMLHMFPLDEDKTVELAKGTETESIRVPTGEKNHIYTFGDLMVRSISAEGSAVVKKSLYGKTVINASSRLGSMKYLSPGSAVWEPFDGKDTQNVWTAGRSVSQIVSWLAGKVYNDHFVAWHGFWFPSEYGVKAGYCMPGMRWQGYDDGQENANQGHWTEKYVADPDGNDTAAYPGYDIWENADITKAEYKTEKLKTGYKINSKTKE